MVSHTRLAVSIDCNNAMDKEFNMFDAKQAKEFMLSGNATFTLRNNVTGNHFTYRVRKGKDDAPHFVQVLTGPNNDADYQFLGTIFGPTSYVHGRKSRIKHTAPSSMAFSWLFRVISHDLAFPASIDVMHAGKCGRCARKLTDPVSLDTGFGPHCRSELAIAS